MLEYFAYKKMKKHRAEKEAARAAEGNSKGKDKEVSSSPSSPRPSHRATRSSSIPSTQLQSESTLSDGNGERQVLTEREAEYFERLTSEAGSVVDDDEGPPPPLPPRIRTPSLYWESDEDERSHKNGKTSSKDRAGSDREHRDHRKDKKDKDKSGSNRLSVLIRKATKRGSSSRLAVPGSSSDVADADREKHDLNRVLEDLNLSARNNKVISMSKESAVLMQRFTQVFKDLVNGVPTAYNDLVSLFNDGDKILAKSYDKLPSSMKKLVTSLPSKLTNSLAPELLAVAAESQGIKATDVGIKTLLEPQNLQELVAKPGAVVGMLKAIMNALKLRWPAFIGSSVLWSVALFCKIPTFPDPDDVSLERS